MSPSHAGLFSFRERERRALYKAGGQSFTQFYRGALHRPVRRLQLKFYGRDAISRHLDGQKAMKVATLGRHFNYISQRL